MAADTMPDAIGDTNHDATDNNNNCVRDKFQMWSPTDLTNFCHTNTVQTFADERESDGRANNRMSGARIVELLQLS